MSPLRLALKRSYRPQAVRSCGPLTCSTRNFTQSPSWAYPKKGSEDRNSINTEATEYSKSGTDNEVAANDEAAFDPNKTSPEQETDTAGKDNKVNPLEVSPGNPEVSKQGGKEAEGGSENAPENKKSGRGSPPKNG